MMKVKLCLAGGAARGIAHIGVVRAMEELDIQAVEVSGASFGALIGALYASGHNSTQMYEILDKFGFTKAFQPAFSFRGLININKVTRYLRKHYPENFEDLNIPLTVVATAIEKGEAHYFSSGPLMPILNASACMPFVFKPVMHNDLQYVDGGIVDNLPALQLKKEEGLPIIGVNCNATNTNKKVKTIKSVMEQTFNLVIAQNMKPNKDYCDCVIEPEALSNYAVYSFWKAKELEQIGYEDAYQKLSAFKEAYMSAEKSS